MSSGSADRNDTGSPVTGCVKASEAACRAGRGNDDAAARAAADRDDGARVPP